MILRWPSWNVSLVNVLQLSIIDKSYFSNLRGCWFRIETGFFIIYLYSWKMQNFHVFDQWQFVWLCTCWILSYLIVIIFHVLDVNKALHLVRVGAHATQHNHFVWDSTHTEIHEIDRTNNGDCVVLGPVEHHHHFPLQEDPCTAHRYSVCQANKH